MILDFGFWTRGEREGFRARAAALGAASEVRFLDVPLPVLLSRLAARNAAPPTHASRVTEAQLNRWWGLFEPPTAEELQVRRA